VYIYIHPKYNKILLLIASDIKQYQRLLTLPPTATQAGSRTLYAARAQRVFRRDLHLPPSKGTSEVRTRDQSLSFCH